MRRRRTLWLIAGLVGGALGLAAGALAAGFRINLSPSMPKGVYRLVQCDQRAGRDAVVGDLVAIDTKAASSNPASRLLPGAGLVEHQRPTGRPAHEEDRRRRWR